MSALIGLMVAVFGGPTALAICAIVLAILVALFIALTPEGRVIAVVVVGVGVPALFGLFFIVKFVGWAASV